MVTSGMSRCHARSTTSDARVGTTSDARVARSYHKNFHVSPYLYDLAISGQYHKVAYISVLRSAATVRGCEHCHKLASHFYDHGRSCLHFEVAYFTIMASTHKRKQRMETLEPVQILKPEWKCPNIGYIDHDRPI